MSICSSTQSCHCLLCEGVEDIRFETTSTSARSSFYPNGKVLGENLKFPLFREFALDGGLTVGQVFRVYVKLLSGETTLQFMIPPVHVAMLVNIRSYSGAVVRNSFLGHVWDREERVGFGFNPHREGNGVSLHRGK